MVLLLVACSVPTNDTSAPPAAACVLEELSAWQEAPHLAREGAALASDGERLYAVGGWDGAALSDQVDVLEPGASVWRPAGRLPEAREHAAAVVLGDRLVVVGGDDGTAKDEVWSAPLSELSQWTAQAPLPAARTFFVLAQEGDAIVLTGGMDANGQAVDSTWQAQVDGADIVGWQALPALPGPRFAAAGALSEGVLTVSGGATSFDRATDEVLRLPLGGAWEAAGRLPEPSLSHAMLARDGLLVLLGSYDWATATAGVWVSPAETLAWSEQAALPAAVFSAGAVLHGDDIWLIGGWVDSLGSLSPQSAHVSVCPEDS